MKKGLWWAQVILALVLTLTIIGLSVVGTLAFRPLYYHDMKEMDLSAYTGLSEEEIRENYDALIDYNMTWKDGDLEFPTLPMSENGKTHFIEVKEIFDIFKYLAVFGGILSMTGIVFMARKKEYRYLKMTAVVSCGLPAVLGILVALFWDKVFVVFHELFFNNDYWIFDYRTDPIILLLPDEFFMHCAFLIFGGVLFGAAVCLGSYLILMRLKKRKET